MAWHATRCDETANQATVLSRDLPWSAGRGRLPAGSSPACPRTLLRQRSWAPCGFHDCRQAPPSQPTATSTSQWAFWRRAHIMSDEGDCPGHRRRVPPRASQWWGGRRWFVAVQFVGSSRTTMSGRAAKETASSMRRHSPAGETHRPALGLRIPRTFVDGVVRRRPTAGSPSPPCLRARAPRGSPRPSRLLLRARLPP